MKQYAVLPRLAGRWFLVIGAFARLPFAMVPIGVMLLVTTTTGSVALGGFATSAAAIGTAVLSPLQGRLADQLGQRPVLLTATAVSALGLVAVTVAAVNNWPFPLLLTACVVTGGFMPQVGPLARVRWLSLTKADRTPMSAAMSWEGTIDELTFVLGPALVGTIAAFAPSSALLVGAGLVAVFATSFALHPTALPAAERVPDMPKPVSTLTVLRAVVAPTLGMCALGSFFGSSQAAVTGVATSLGNPGSAGLLYAVMGVGSAITALALVALPARITARTRWIFGGTGMALTMAMATMVTTAWPTAIALFITGLFIGPAIVTLFTVCGEAAPPRAAGTAMTLLVSANVVGVAVGAAIGGQVVEDLSHAGSGAGLAFVVPAISALLLAASAGLLRNRTQSSVATTD